MSFVCVDLGASGTRYCSDSGQIFTIPNNMEFLGSDATVNIEPDSDTVESALEVHISKSTADENNYFPADVLIGIMAKRHATTEDRPSVNKHKHVQRINYVSAITACALSKLKYNNLNDIDLYIAVPPIEVSLASVAFKNGLVGEYTVSLPKYMGGTTVSFRIRDVFCYEESQLAVLSFFFNKNGTLKDVARKYMNGKVLSLDIGASTTDISITEGGVYLNKSGQTYKTGGNVARDILIDMIREKYAMELPIENAEATMAEGRLQRGNMYEDVSQLVSEAKAQLAKTLTGFMQTYFKKINIDVQTINAIVVSGGGSLQSQYVNDNNDIVKTSEPMSGYVTHELLDWSPGTDVVAYGADARIANITGLFIRAKLEAVQRANEQAQAAADVEQTAPVSQQAVEQTAPAATPAAAVETHVAPAATPVTNITEVANG